MSPVDFLPCRLLRRPGAIKHADWFRSCQIDDVRLAEVLSADTPLLVLHEGAIHAEGPAWQASHGRLLFSDVPNRRLNAWYEEDGRVEVAIDATWFMNGNAVAPDGTVWHCEHGRRCISRSTADLTGGPEPFITHFEGKRLNSPNDVTVAPDGSIWFTDPIFGIVMPSQGALAEPELDHRSVYRFDPANGELTRVADFEQPNGVALSADGGTLYVSDTSLSLGEVPGFTAGTKHEVLRFRHQPDGSWGERTRFCRTDHGYRDGFTTDARGWLWVGAADGVHVWSADGDRLGFVPIDATVSNLCFGGSDGRRLFIAAESRLLALDLKADA
ncbi:SMP-30/gluconolactonase/LRE family protein [Sphingomonas sp. S-NIH.Pt15_0812]|uniref:SMP-30/gluconolactonase/LRE family protein n=1 Tax=Sphingomonas sp. S-NIH.Pt15_0812 TaxID=1920129 RepID=UPI000F7F63B4|nr:SMP-30/gluconolactonase/LRE family protein [Sphingomonas sp. S-NIH.Pt15_0812]RSU47691.1 SMP-30/gluconolactonase/LRE family protein [Sphingomonas sp. S-NIH.Pt15_0812]